LHYYILKGFFISSLNSLLESIGFGKVFKKSIKIELIGKDESGQIKHCVTTHGEIGEKDKR
jgi:hypothetical protein